MHSKKDAYRTISAVISPIHLMVKDYTVATR